MINFSFNLSWPWYKNAWDKSKDYFYKSWRVSKLKTLEFQISKGGDTLIGTSFRWDTNCDHAGITVDVSLFRYFVYIAFVDNRHWDYENNRYEEYVE